MDVCSSSADVILSEMHQFNFLSLMQTLISDHSSALLML